MKKTIKNAQNVETMETAETLAIAYVNACKALTAAEKTNKHDKVVAAEKNAAKTRAALNKAIQLDTFRAACADTTAPALVNVAKMGVYPAAVGMDNETDTIQYSPEPLDLDAFLDFMVSAGKITRDTSARYHRAVKDAVDLAVIKYAQGTGENIPALLEKIKPSDTVRDISGVDSLWSTAAENVSYNNIESYLQIALDVMIKVDRGDGKNTFTVKRKDARGFEGIIPKNGKTKNVVYPVKPRSKYALMFRVMRRVIGGMEWETEVKVKEGKKAQ